MTVIKKIGLLSSRIVLRADEMKTITDKLFSDTPRHETRNEILNADISLFATEELCEIVSTLKNRKLLTQLDYQQKY